MAIIGTYTEFYVSKEPGANDDNGGGPRFTANGSPVDSSVNCSVDGTGLIITNNAGNWTDVAIDDWIIWDINDLLGNGREWRRITALPAANQITVNAVVNGGGAGGPNVKVIVGGHWLTINHALGRTLGTDCGVSMVSVNSLSHIPRINVKGYAPGVNDYSWMEPSLTGTSPIIISIEGYEIEAGDGCPNKIRPVLSDTDVIIFDTAHYYSFDLIDIYGDGNTDVIRSTGGLEEFHVFTNCRITKTGNAAGKQFVTSDIGRSLFLGCEFLMAGTGTVRTDMYGGNVLFGCRLEGGTDGVWGNLKLEASMMLFTISSGSSDTFGVFLEDNSFVSNCVSYNNSGPGYYSMYLATVVENSISLDNTFNEFFTTYEALSWPNNCGFGAAIPFGGDNEYPNSIEADPRMYDPANDNFQLGPNSPCIDRAVPGVFPFMTAISDSIGKLDIGPFQSRRRVKAVSPVVRE